MIGGGGRGFRLPSTKMTTTRLCLRLLQGQARRDGKARYGTFTPSCTMEGKCVPRVIIRSSRAVWKGVQQGQHAFTMESTRDGLAAPPSAPLPKFHPGISNCWRRKPCQPGTRVGQRAGARAQEPSAGLLGSNGGAIAATIWKQTPMGQVRAVRDGGAGGAGGGGVTAPRRTLHVMVREENGVPVAVMVLLRLQKAHGANGRWVGGRADGRAGCDDSSNARAAQSYVRTAPTTVTVLTACLPHGAARRSPRQCDVLPLTARPPSLEAAMPEARIQRSSGHDVESPWVGWPLS